MDKSTRLDHELWTAAGVIALWLKRPKEIEMEKPEGLIVQVKADGSLSREETLMVSVATRLDVPVLKCSEKQMERAKIKVLPGMVVAGTVPFVKHALRQLGKPLPPHTPYPAELKHLLHREVKLMKSLAEAKAVVANGKRLFIKPVEGWKRFTGFVAEFETDYRFNGASGAKPVWTADPVKFVSEWRAYVAKSEVLAIGFADHGGDRNLPANHEIIRDSVRILARAEQTPAGYCIDFGVLETGETALIEMNDGFSFGAYDNLAPQIYWDVTVNRWLQYTA